MATKMKSIEIKKVASANEAVAIISRLNYTGCTFEYRNSTFSDDYATEYRHFNTDNAFALTEIVMNGTLVAVRFANIYREIYVELQLADAIINHDSFDNIISVEEIADVPAAKEETKKTIVMKIAKNGTVMYYRVDSKGKKTRIDGVTGVFEYAHENKLGGFREESTAETQTVTEADVEDYAVTTDAQDVAIEAEENLADAQANPFKFENIVARFKAQIAEADAELEAAEQAERLAYETWLAAQKVTAAAIEKRSEAFRVYNQFGFRQTRELRDKLLPQGTEFNITLHARDENFSAENPCLTIAYYQDKFLISQGFHKFATYDTPEQVEAAFKRLNNAIDRGESQFTFPTIAQLSTPKPEPDYSPEYMLGIINEVDAINSCAPDGWQVEFNPVENNFSVAFNGASVADIDSLALAKVLPPDKFFDRFKPIIDDAPQDLYREDLLRELDELQAMREQLGNDLERIKTLDELIEQTKRELVRTEFSAVDFDENGNITNIWF